MLKKVLAMVLALVLLVSFTAMAATSNIDVEITQVVQQKGERETNLYVSVLDENGFAIPDLDASNFSVSTNAQKDVRVSSVLGGNSQGIAYTFCVDISKSLSAKEFKQIQDVMADFIGNDYFTDADYGRIVTLGTTAQEVCPFTNDKGELLAQMGNLKMNAKDTYLYEGIHSALNSVRNHPVEVPDRHMIIVFSDCKDDAKDSTISREQVLADVEEIHAPIYFVAFNGKQKNEEDIKNAQVIASKSHGALYSYADKLYSEFFPTSAVAAIVTVSFCSYCIVVEPEYNNTTQAQLKWSVTYNGIDENGSEVVYSSKDYACDIAPWTTAAPTDAPTQAPATIIVETPDVKKESSFMDWIRDNWYIVLAIVLILIAIIIIVVVLTKRKNSAAVVNSDEEEVRAPESVLTPPEENHDETVTGPVVSPGVPVFTTNPPPVQPKPKSGKPVIIEFRCGTERKTKRYMVSAEGSIVGKSSEADIKVAIDVEQIKSVSGKHATLTLAHGEMFIHDNRSTNGTFVNGKRIGTDDVKLSKNDVVRLGGFIEMRAKPE